MDPESKKLLQDTFALTQENNKLLHGMRRAMRMQRFMSYIYWAFIILSAAGAYYFIQPYVNKIVDIYGSMSGFVDSIKHFNQ